nr:hypothetical protein [Tanacetum cinerariifolium]
IEEDAEEEKEDPKEDPEEDPEEEPEDDDDDMEIDDEAEEIDPYMDDGLNNPTPLNSEDEETPPTSPVIPDADGKMEKFMSERIDTEERIKNKFKEQDRHFLGLGCDNIEMDRTVRNVMSDLSGLKKLVKGLSDRFDEDAAIADAAIATFVLMMMMMTPILWTNSPMSRVDPHVTHSSLVSS